MDDKITLSVRFGLIVIPVCALLLHAFTDISKWIAYPVGGIAGFLVVTTLTYMIISLHERIFGPKESDYEDYI